MGEMVLFQCCGEVSLSTGRKDRGPGKRNQVRSHVKFDHHQPNNCFRPSKSIISMSKFGQRDR